MYLEYRVEAEASGLDLGVGAEVVPHIALAAHLVEGTMRQELMVCVR